MRQEENRWITSEWKIMRFCLKMTGKCCVLEPWGKDSLRVRAAMMREIQDTDYALLPAGETEAVIQIKDGFTGSITNGRITACLEVCQWKKRCQISFYNQKGELLLKEAGLAAL